MRVLAMILLLALVMPALAVLEIPEGMVLVPGARYAMGVSQLELEDLADLGRDVPHMGHHYTGWFSKELPLHEVVVETFFLDAREVTNAEYEQFVKETGYESGGDWREYAGEDREQHPVVNVTWKDARAYAEWTGGRLPTEVEWEWAARGGGDSRWFPWGDEADDYKLANYGHDRTFWAGVGNLFGLLNIKTETVGSYAANDYGLFDMQGNVSEWCADELLPYPDAPMDVHPWGMEGYLEHPWKNCRGGSWESPNPVFVRSNHRKGWPAETSRWGIGFRCARSLPVDNSSK